MMANQLKRTLFMLIVHCERTWSCDYSLVTGPYGVTDDAITASTFHHTCPIIKVRFSDTGWCPSSRVSGNYIQVEFRTVSLVKAIQTKGRSGNDQFVTSYTASTSMDGLSWKEILDSAGAAQVFPGNSDRNTIVTNELEGSIIAKFIRVTTVSYNDMGSMRLEVIGCPVPCDTWHKWKAKLGSTGENLKVLSDTVVSNNGLCGVKCSRQEDCVSFIFDVTSARCVLLKDVSDGSQDTINLDRVWYFTRN